MKGNCRLYEIETELCESHIIPKFVIDYFKLTGSKFLRYKIEPNRRVQDGPKEYYLSSNAEQKFSKHEKWFAENIFYKYLENGNKTFNYDENLFNFSISVLWRVLLKNLEDPNISKQPYITELLEAEKEWKFFLREGIYPTQYDRVYLYFTDRLSSHNLEAINVDYYMTRAIDATIVYTPNNKFVAVYCKFLRFIFWGIIKGGDEAKISDLKIHPIGGKISTPQKFEENAMTSFLTNRIKQLAAMPSASEKQQDIILKEILKDREGFLQSDAGKSLTNDRMNLDPEE